MQELWWGVKEVFAELFTNLDCALDYTGNPKGELIAAIGHYTWSK